MLADLNKRNPYQGEPPKEKPKQTPHEVRFINRQGEVFKTLADLEEYELKKEIHKNLYSFLCQKLHIQQIKPVF